MKLSARDAYDQLFQYFGLRARDGYLSAATGQNVNSPKKTDDSVLGDVYHYLYGDENYNPTITEICDKIIEMPGGLDVSEKVICITPYTYTELGKSNDETKLPMNGTWDWSKAKKLDQGLIGNEGNAKKLTSDGNRAMYSVKNLNSRFDNDHARIDVIQVFPCRGINEVADVDILTLYLSTINSVNMSQAVPYVNVLVSTQGAMSRDKNGEEVKPNISSQAFSFGSFLRAESDDMQNATFQDQSLSGAGYKKSEKVESPSKWTQSVASMEIFTSPQTLINASPSEISYDENVDAGRHVDVFRPFLSLESLTLNVVPASAGLIAFKTANMKIKLFDRGNLSKITPLVAPSRFGLVKFDIEYGWSHPAGDLVQRASDAQDDRIGLLIDSMRVTESYQVINSNFTFEQDGSVSIDLKLSMLGAASLSSKSIQFSESDGDVEEIQALLEEVGKLLDKLPPEVNRPSVITGNVDTFISMDPEEKKSLLKFVHSLSSKGGLASQISSKVAGLIVDRKGDPSKYKKFQDNRKKQIQSFINNLKVKDDPFLRTEGLSGYGVTKSELSGNNNVNYTSFGTIVLNALGPIFQNTGEVIFVFSCFNKNAGAMYDHNIAQFPIKLTSKNEKDVVLQNVLEREMKKTSRITPERFLEIINEKFLLRESSEAYGLSDLYKDQPVFDDDGNIKDVYAAKVQNDSEKPETQVLFEDKKIENLKNIYGGSRMHANFTLPRIAMKIDVKPSKDGKKNVVRVTFFDQAASNVGDMQEIFNEITSNGFFMKEDYTNKNITENVRSAQHGVVAEKAFEAMTAKGFELIEKWTPNPKENDPPTLLEKLEQLAKKDSPIKFEEDVEGSSKRNDLIKKLDSVYFMKNFASADNRLRNIFYKFFPTLIYGSMGSGIISAQLSSNQNDALNTIALQKEPNETDVPTGLPMLIHPTQLSLEVFGTPMFKYSQKFFVDFGTGTSADNFYVVSGVDMSFGPGEFKCSLKMTQLDVFGRFMKLRDTIYKTLISSLMHEKKKKLPKKAKQKMNAEAELAALDQAAANIEAQEKIAADNAEFQRKVAAAGGFEAYKRQQERDQRNLRNARRTFYGQDY